MISEVELQRTKLAIQAAYSIPLIDDVEDYVWESIWSYVKCLPELDGLTRKKRLFDVVDFQRQIGWSAKTLVIPSGPLLAGREFEFVIQRADIIKKRNALGFPDLSISDDPQHLGDALLEHWRRKIFEDAAFQKVSGCRISILLKDKLRQNFAVMDEVLEVPEDENFVWNWSGEDKVGLQGRSVEDGQIRYRWYRNQTQFFERIKIPESAEMFSVNWQKMPLSSLIEAVS